MAGSRERIQRPAGVRIGILDRYVAREVAAPIALSLGAITVALIVARLLKLVDLIVNQGVAPGEVLSLLGYLLPSLIGLSLPMAVLLGTLLGIGRLSGDHEVVAARACGVSLLRLALPIILVGALLYPFEVLIATRIAPWANSQLRSGILELMRTRLTAGLPEKVFNHAFDGLVVYFDRLEPTDHKLINVMISDARNPSTKTKIVARSGFLISRSQDPVVTLRLLDGWMFVEEEHDAGRIIRFDTYDVSAMPHQDSAFINPTPLELSMATLRQHIRDGRRSGHRDIETEIELAHRFAIPLMIFPFALIGMTLGMAPVRGGRSERFGFALLLFFCYYVLMRGGEALARAHMVDSYLGAVIPDLVFVAVALAPFLRHGFDLEDPGSRMGARILQWLIAIKPRAQAAG